MTITRDRAWHLLTALVCAASLSVQFYLSWTNTDTALSPYRRPMRMANVLEVALLLIGLGAAFVGLDRRLPKAPVRP